MKRQQFLFIDHTKQQSPVITSAVPNSPSHHFKWRKAQKQIIPFWKSKFPFKLQEGDRRVGIDAADTAPRCHLRTFLNYDDRRPLLMRRLIKGNSLSLHVIR